MTKRLPVALGMCVGLFVVAEYFIPRPEVQAIASHVYEWGALVAAAAFVLGAIHVVQVTWPKIKHREADWPYKIVLLASAAIMIAVGLPWRDVTGSEPPGKIWKGGHDDAAALRETAFVIVESPADVIVRVNATDTAQGKLEVPAGKITIHAARNVAGYDVLDDSIEVAPGEILHVTADPQMRWGADGRFRTWIYDHVLAPCDATLFALLAFFVASAAFRAFRARNIESALLLGSAIVILLARAPIGRALSSSLPDIAQWILDVPSNGSRRAIIMGAAVGAIATGLRVILGIERSHLGGD